MPNHPRFEASIGKKLAILGVLLSISVAWATTLNQGGFFDPADPRVPSAITGAAKSVFRVYAASRLDSRNIDVTRGKGARLRAQISASSKYDDLEKKIIIRQIDVCESNHAHLKPMRESCEISRNISQGSGFLVNDGRTLWTAFHVVQTAMGLQESLFGNSSEVPIQVFIFDADGNLMIDPLELRIEPVLTPEMGLALNDRTNPILTANFDSIELKLPMSIGEPLPIALHAPKENEPLFAIGFPAATGGDFGADLEMADRRPWPNSDGKHQFVSMGVVTNFASAESIFKAARENGFILAQDNPRAVFTNVDTVHGNSGGPVLNERGEVAGLVSMGSAVGTVADHRMATVLSVPEAWSRSN